MTDYNSDVKRVAFTSKTILDHTDINKPFADDVDDPNDVEGWSQSDNDFFSKQLMPFCAMCGVSDKIAKRIMGEYHQQAIEALQNDPFAVIERVSFYTLVHAEKFADVLGIAQDDERRLRGYIYHAMNKAIDGGDTKIEEYRLHKKFMYLFPNHNYDLARSYTSLFEVGNGFLTTPTLYERERGIADLVQLKTETDNNLFFFEKGYLEGLNKEQINAIKMAFSNPVSIINGLGGTGKTKVIIHICEIADALGLSVVLLAPTGRAARNMSNVVNRPASTIHKFLYKRMASKKNKMKEYDIVIVDEGYMTDSLIYGWLCNEIRDSVRHLINLGDGGQLQPVGAGEPLKCLTNRIPTTELITNYRSNQIIQHNCLAVRANRMSDLDYSNPEQWAYFGPDILGYINAPEFRDRQLITVGASGKYGSKRLNFIIQAMRNNDSKAIIGNPYINNGDFCILNEELENMRTKRVFNEGQHARVVDLKKRQNTLTVEFVTGGQMTMSYREFKQKFTYQKAFRLGDKVMQTANDYERNIDNGDVGTVVEVYRNYFVAEYAPRKKGMRPHLAKHTKTKQVIEDVVLAYVLNVHKVQGDEYDKITFIIDKSFFQMLRTTELFYTGLSRGKNSVHIIGDYATMDTLIPTPPRKTMIADFLEGRYND